ncbi:MAG: hypothetical protein KatS3mg085_397 [Candidatus Dojkabacteria bacterium]|nr:MAG: hypothetical protein KatS3mg085_397 [Candidatus Dojkabacteria bacterium]
MYQLETLAAKKNAQIMLITLMVLVILGVIISGIVIILQSDTSQTVSNEKYEQLYNNAEENLKKIAKDYAAYTVSLSSIPTNFTECVEQIAGIKYQCQFNDSQFTTISVSNTTQIEESKVVSDYEIKKDEMFTINLNNYKNEIIFKWDRDSAIELGLLFQDSAGQYRIVKDVFDPTNLFSSGTVNPHSFNFSPISGEDPNKSFSIDLSSVSSVGSTDNLLYLTVTPRMRDTFGSIRINIEPLDPSTFPYQVRIITSSSLDQNDGQSPVVKLQTQIPLTPQIDSIFDYSLLSNGDIGL